MRTSVYIDGFNLYYGALKGTPYRWLNPMALVEKVLRPGHEVECIKYFTAKVAAFLDNPDVRARQTTYIRALRSIPEIQVIYGAFLTNEVRMRRADGRGSVRVLKTEEKGSDVNLATHLVVDAFRQQFEAAIVISNDSDLREPVRIVREELGLKVGVFVPMVAEGRRRSRVLTNAATFWAPIRLGPVRDSQFPDAVDLGEGKSVTRPDRWR